ncbi:biliverdin-producing heme oxygenase [Stutzerimonas tarimensis]|uniref:Biliverdin-producing heme oxygenase n=1 Tax=Stutzerimonas tarimensis TaxID=1507735 RepID=A0ABV7T865_9GAMM
MESLRDRLRQVSAEWHDQVDQVFSSFPLDTPEGYCRFLEAHARALLPLEEGLEARGIERLLPDWHGRRRRFVLAQDIETLGGSVPSAPALELPQGDAWLWGAAYVVEGSRMGSRMLGKRLQDSDRSWAHPALGYLCHRLDTPLWPAFVKRLDGQAGTLDDEAMIAGARATFALFQAAGKATSEVPASV